MKVTDVSLKLDVDFEREVLDGNVILSVDKVDKGATHLVREQDRTLKWYQIREGSLCLCRY